MGIFETLFRNKKLKTTDSDFGEIESFSTRGNEVGWQINRRFLDSDIEILIGGDKDGISDNQKQILMNALNNEPNIKSESEEVLKEQYENAEMEFISMAKHFQTLVISVNDDGFEINLKQKEKPYYYFNVHFEKNKCVGVSIDS